MVNSHNPGEKHVKSYSVSDFLEAMMHPGIYDDRDEKDDSK